MKTNYDYKLLGFNFRMTEMQAAMGRIQLKRLPIFIKKRIRNAIYLTRKLKRIEGIKPPQIAEGHVFNQYTIIVEEDFKESRDELRKRLEKKGIQTRIYYPCPLHKISFIENRETLPCAERMSRMVLSLPVHPSLTLKELEYITTCIGGYND
jgi:perosamine synthetase